MMENVHKSHRQQKSGKKVKKKDSKVDRHNPKAFTFSGGWKAAQQRAQRSAEIAEKREKFVRVIDKTPSISPPPYIIVVQGPPGCGKSTLIKSLVKHYTKQSINTLNGPVTCVVSKSRRLTFVECANDVSAMIDLAKIADLAILMIDGEHGLEMPTFEFVNMMQNHGFPRILGVLSKLDLLKENKALKKFKKSIKARFWAEIYDGAKLFYLTGLKRKNYLKREVLNLSRFISVQKYEPLVWRSQRPYLLGLSVEVLPGVQSEGDGPPTHTITVLGYVRGARLRPGQLVHVPGCGDLAIKAVEKQSDPCPFPDSSEKQSKDSGKLLRKLKQQHRLLFAPTSDVGQVEVDGSSMYIKLPSNRMAFTPKDKLLKENLCDNADSRDANGAAPQMQLNNAESDDTWSTGESSEADEQSEATDEIQSESEEKLEGVSPAIRKIRQMQSTEGVIEERLQKTQLRLFDKSSVDLEQKEASEMAKALEENDDELNELETFDINRLDVETLPIIDAFKEIQRSARMDDRLPHDKDLFRFVYASNRQKLRSIDQNHQRTRANNKTEALFDDEGDEIFEQDEDVFDTNRLCDEDIFRPAKLLFETWKREQHEDLKHTDQGSVRTEGLSETFCDGFLSLLRSISFITGGWEDGPSEQETQVIELPSTLEEFEKQRWEARKKAFAQRNAEGEEVQSLLAAQDEQFGIGSFVRLTIAGVGTDWVARVLGDGGVGIGQRPVVVGALLPGEQALTFVHCRVKRHRWSPGILKTTEPLLFSLGWRRFQSLPYFAMEDRNNTRRRYLKYTPEHMHCQALIYAHSATPGTGLFALKHWDEKLADFRISMTGVVIENDANPCIHKKLKLIGSPNEIKKNTAFIQGMFSSDLEIAKVEGVAIQTQSGIRGVIKKARGLTGEFRATFEAQIRKSDVVFCKAWYRVPLEQFCNLQTDDGKWDRVRTFVELRRELKISAPTNTESQYGPRVQRAIKEARKMKLDRDLMAHLPYGSIPKLTLKRTANEKMVYETLKPTRSAHDKLVASLIARAAEIKQAHTAHRKERLLEKSKLDARAQAREAKLHSAKEKDRKKREFAKKGKRELFARKRMRFE